MDNVYRITIPLRLFRAATVRESPWLGLESLPITPVNAGGDCPLCPPLGQWAVAPLARDAAKGGRSAKQLRNELSQVDGSAARRECQSKAQRSRLHRLNAIRRL